MLIERTLAAVFGSNCYVLAAEPGAPALVVDPGAGAARGAMALMRSNHLRLGAILLTHGHADHVWDAQRLIDAAVTEGRVDAGPGGTADPTSVPVYIPQPDHYRLDDPAATTGITVDGKTFADLAGSAWLRPADVRPFPQDGFVHAVELVPGVAVRAVPAPGHSEGSTLFFLNARLGDNQLLFEAEALDDPADADERDYLVALDGDVIFKGSVGRTDLPGGDQYQMWATLRLLASAVDPDTVLLPGHGAATTMAHEHHANPYLAEAKVRGGETGA
ncbi:MULTISPECIES: MBL fold metallo-hydrolase [unclassified Actinomyces]|uniref:MBL fold metallo-hydrolase n=1 Tax=unclassified Actinomyces TaxID=2609248 RepID=UPI00137424FE|nr:MULTISPECIES: MBL fold metallo-hydrolase [unclassified Actinomyces]NDR54683.1 MBL fold metallo-hydrolase [Actinomyces sp. 565]QHO90955.1 MBL fold metallo-hydrolase [Actinomyces sp. 432]